MARQTIGGLLEDRARGEKVLAELQAADFPTAHISLGTTGYDFHDNLTALGISAADTRYFADGVARGAALVTVRSDARASEAIAILASNGADLGETAYTGDRTLELKAERLEIEKVRVASGTAHVRKEVISEQQFVDVPVSHEELVIDRHAVTGGAIGGTIGSAETIVVPLSREEIRVGKQTYVTEEVEVGKRAVGGIERVTETVRHEELAVHEDPKSDLPIRYSAKAL